MLGEWATPKSKDKAGRVILSPAFLPRDSSRHTEVLISLQGNSGSGSHTLLALLEEQGGAAQKPVAYLQGCSPFTSQRHAKAKAVEKGVGQDCA